MKAVTKEEFYKTIGHLNVSPSILNNKWCDNLGYVSNWILPNRQVVGKTQGSGKKEYFLAA